VLGQSQGFHDGRVRHPDNYRDAVPALVTDPLNHLAAEFPAEAGRFTGRPQGKQSVDAALDETGNEPFQRVGVHSVTVP
jgi:hypothetical protein